jgi:hypothetical protein
MMKLSGVDWADLETVTREPWLVEPKDKNLESEEQRQATFLRDLKRIAPAILVWAVPNGGKRSTWAGMKAKREGMRAGCLDLTIVWDSGVAFIEFKSGSGIPSETQIDMLDDLMRRNHHCCVARTSAWALAWLREIGAPVRII